MTRRRRLGAFPGPCVVSWVHLHCYLGTPLLARGHERPAASALLAAMGRGAAWAGFRELPAGGAAASALSAAGRGLVLERAERAVLEPGTAAGSARLNAKARADLRRRGRRLAEEVGTAAEVRVTGGRDAAERLLALEHSGWKRESGTSLLSRPAETAFFREAVEGLGERIRFYCLDAGDRSTAVGSVISAGDTDFLFKTAYDDALARHSPGLQLAVATIDALAAEGRRVDSCAAPDSRYVNDLLPQRRTMTTLAFPRAPGYRSLLRAAGAARSLRRRRPSAGSPTGP